MQDDAEVKETIIQMLIKNGPLGVALAVIVFLHIDGIKTHRSERDQWRQEHSAERDQWRIDVKEMTNDFIDHADKNGEALRDIMLELREQRNNQ